MLLAEDEKSPVAADKANGCVHVLLLLKMLLVVAVPLPAAKGEEPNCCVVLSMTLLSPKGKAPNCWFVEVLFVALPVASVAGKPNGCGCIASGIGFGIPTGTALPPVNTGFCDGESEDCSRPPVVGGYAAGGEKAG